MSEAPLGDPNAPADDPSSATGGKRARRAAATTSASVPAQAAADWLTRCGEQDPEVTSEITVHAAQAVALVCWDVPVGRAELNDLVEYANATANMRRRYLFSDRPFGGRTVSMADELEVALYWWNEAGVLVPAGVLGRRFAPRSTSTTNEAAEPQPTPARPTSARATSAQSTPAHTTPAEQPRTQATPPAATPPTQPPSVQGRPESVAPEQVQPEHLQPEGAQGTEVPLEPVATQSEVPERTASRGRRRAAVPVDAPSPASARAVVGDPVAPLDVDSSDHAPEVAVSVPADVAAAVEPAGAPDPAPVVEPSAFEPTESESEPSAFEASDVEPTESESESSDVASVPEASAWSAWTEYVPAPESAEVPDATIPARVAPTSHHATPPQQAPAAAAERTEAPPLQQEAPQPQAPEIEVPEIATPAAEAAEPSAPAVPMEREATAPGGFQPSQIERYLDLLHNRASAHGLTTPRQHEAPAASESAEGAAQDAPAPRPEGAGLTRSRRPDPTRQVAGGPDQAARSAASRPAGPIEGLTPELIFPRQQSAPAQESLPAAPASEPVETVERGRRGWFLRRRSEESKPNPSQRSYQMRRTLEARQVMLETGLPSVTDFPEVLDWLRQGDRARAIALYRKTVGVGLVEAIDAIDALGGEY